VRNGRPHPDGEALTAAEARARFEEGYSTVLRHCEEHDEGLCRVATAFERDFGGDVAVHALATPAGFCSFGWRRDCEDAFIVQTSGVKEYRLRPNTVNPAPSIDAMPRNMRFERETTPVFACTLVAGDVAACRERGKQRRVPPQQPGLDAVEEDRHAGDVVVQPELLGGARAQHQQEAPRAEQVLGGRPLLVADPAPREHPRTRWRA
jgi:hypothetical protein